MAKPTISDSRVIPPNRRRWSEPDKLRILMETLEPGRTVLSVSRKHGVSAVSIYTWRRELAVPLARLVGEARDVPERRGGSESKPSSTVGEAALCARLSALESQVEEIKAQCVAMETTRRSLADALRSMSHQLDRLAHLSESVPHVSGSATPKGRKASERRREREPSNH
jgi:transposase-like protein